MDSPSSSSRLVSTVFVVLDSPTYCPVPAQGRSPDVPWTVWQCCSLPPPRAFYGSRLLSCWHPSMAPMWYPTFAVTRAFREYVLLAPQLVYQDWLTACRSSAPHFSSDTGTPHRRSVAFFFCSGRADCPLVSRLLLFQGYHGHTRLCWLSFQFWSPSLSLCCRNLSAMRFLAVRYTARCYSWRLAASAVSLFLLPVRSFSWFCSSHC